MPCLSVQIALEVRVMNGGLTSTELRMWVNLAVLEHLECMVSSIVDVIRVSCNELFHIMFLLSNCLALFKSIELNKICVDALSQ